MTTLHRTSLLKLALMAACADPAGGATGQAQLRRVAESLTEVAGENLALALRDILLQRLPLGQLIGPLGRPEYKVCAYEVAVCICNADGVHSDLEHAFLERLRMALALDVRTARSLEREAIAITGVPLQPDPSRAPLAPPHPVDDAAVDRLIDEYAVLNAALATRAEPLALLATIPLAMKLAYRIGKAYGHEPDRGQVLALFGSVGQEPVAQYVEACGHLILWGAMDRPRIQAGNGPVAEAARNCYARTIALGRVALAVYRDGRDDTAELHERYAAADAGARNAYDARAGDIGARAHQTAVNDLLSLVKQ